MKKQYKKLRLKTKKDFTIAEKYQVNGWKVILVGIETILIEK